MFTTAVLTILLGAALSVVFYWPPYFLYKKIKKFIKEIINAFKERRERRVDENLFRRDKGNDLINEFADADEGWSAMIENAVGRGDEFLERVARRALNENIPNLAVRKRMFWPGERQQRPFLIITNKRFRGYEILVGAGDYTSRLNVVWRVDRSDPETALLKRAEGRQWKYGVESSGILAGKEKGSWIYSEWMDAADKQEWENGVGLLREIVRDEIKNMANETRLGVRGEIKGFINIV